MKKLIDMAYQLIINEYNKFKQKILESWQTGPWEIGSQMPCRVSYDVHQRANVVPTVPTWYLLNPQSGEQSGIAQWEEKTPWTGFSEKVGFNNI